MKSEGLGTSLYPGLIDSAIVLPLRHAFDISRSSLNIPASNKLRGSRLQQRGLLGERAWRGLVGGAERLLGMVFTDGLRVDTAALGNCCQSIRARISRSEGTHQVYYIDIRSMRSHIVTDSYTICTLFNMTTDIRGANDGVPRYHLTCMKVRLAFFSKPPGLQR